MFFCIPVGKSSRQRHVLIPSDVSRPETSQVIEVAKKTSEYESRSPLYTPNDSHIVLRLPPELLVHVVKYLIPPYPWSFHRSHEFDLDPELALAKIEANSFKHQRTLVHLMELDWSWHRALKPVLYGRPVLISSVALRSLASRISMDPSSAELMKELVLLDRTGGEEQPTSFYSTVYCGAPEERAATQAALKTMLTLNNSRVISVVFVTTRSPTITSGACGASLLGRLPRLSSQHPKSVKGDLIDADRDSVLLLDGLRSLTLHGYASHLIFAPSSRAFDNSRVGFTRLESLVLDSLHLSEADWPTMPALVSLVIKNCSQAERCLPTREQAPCLTSLVINPEWTGMNIASSALANSLKEHAPYLLSLWIEYAIFREIFTAPNLFNRLRELGTQHGYRMRAQVDPLSLGTRLPTSLRVLRVVDIRSHFPHCTVSYMCALFHPDCVESVLANVWRHREVKYEMQITGSELFWQGVDLEVMAAAKLAAQENGISWTTRYDEARTLDAHPFFVQFPERIGPVGVVIWRDLPDTSLDNRRSVELLSYV